MKEYTSEEFYRKHYLLGRSAILKDESFHYWITKASAKIRRYTFDRVDALNELPEAVQMCCCEIAETLFRQESSKDESGRILQNYGNDGDSGTFLTESLTSSSIEKEVRAIVRLWLSDTNLLYCGV